MGGIVIGGLAGVVCLWGVHGLKRMLNVDDSLDVFGVHGIGGTWGSIATGLWATTEVNPAGADGLRRPVPAEAQRAPAPGLPVRRDGTGDIPA